MEIGRALIVARKARITRHVPSDAAAQGDIVANSRSARPFLRDERGCFAKGGCGGPGRPPRDALREAYVTDLFLIWKRRGRHVIRQLAEENPAAYLRLIAGLASKMTKAD